MPIPIPAGFNIKIQHNIYPHPGDMAGMCCAQDHYTIGYSISGDRKTITSSTITEFHAGQIGMIAPGVLHRTVAMSDKPYERILIKYKFDMAKPFIDLVGRSVFDELYQTHILCFPPEVQHKIFTIMMEMNDEFEHYDQYSEYVLKGMLTHLLLVIMKGRIPSEHESIHFPFENQQVLEATCYIESNYDQNISISDVAEHVNLSRSYLSAQFKKMTGNTYTNYLNNVRLQHALILLNEKENSITDIALKCGFSNANYFCDVFKKRFTYSPTAFRNFYKKEK